jgi:hypothetical protein
MELADLRQRVYDDVSKGSETFEAFGLKFPGAQVTFWGLTVLIAMQVYVYFYLGQLRGKLHPDDAAWDVPWVGMDRSLPARFMLFATLVVAPVLAIALLCSRAVSRMLLGGPAVSWRCRSWTWYPHLTWWQDLRLVGLSLAVLIGLFLAIRSWMMRPDVAESKHKEIAFE